MNHILNNHKIKKEQDIKEILKIVKQLSFWDKSYIFTVTENEGIFLVNTDNKQIKKRIYEKDICSIKKLGNCLLSQDKNNGIKTAFKGKIYD